MDVVDQLAQGGLGGQQGLGHGDGVAGVLVPDRVGALGQGPRPAQLELELDVLGPGALQGLAPDHRDVGSDALQGFLPGLDVVDYLQVGVVVGSHQLHLPGHHGLLLLPGQAGQQGQQVVVEHGRDLQLRPHQVHGCLQGVGGLAGHA